MIELRIKELFLDREAILSRMPKAKRVAGNRIGGWIRTTSKRSIRKRKGSSSPGQPPFSHKGWLKNNIFYSWDSATESVPIGPILIKTPHPSARPISGTVPQIIEEGGRVLRTLRHSHREVQRTIRARPFMGPALAKGRQSDSLAKFWKDVL